MTECEIEIKRDGPILYFVFMNRELEESATIAVYADKSVCLYPCTLSNGVTILDDTNAKDTILALTNVLLRREGGLT